MQLPEPERKSIPFSAPLFSSLRISQVFRHSTKQVTSLSFDDTGELCITSSEDESLRIYDCREGKLRNTLFSKKYGVNLVRFTHRQNNVINASTKEDDTIRYLSLHDNKYIRYFKGHCNRVIALEFSPVDDQFLSAATDDTVRLWDLRSSACQGLIKIRGRPTVAFNETGVVFALGLGSDTLKLYDLKALEKGPFSTWNIYDPFLPHFKPEWTSLAFSSDGKNILVTTATDVHYLIDAYKGHLKQRLVGHNGVGSGRNGEEAGFTPDGKFVVAGSQDGTIYIWAVEDQNYDSQPIAFLEGHTTTAGVVGFNPKYMMMVSGSTELAFWEPDLQELQM